MEEEKLNKFINELCELYVNVINSLDDLYFNKYELGKKWNDICEKYNFEGDE